MTTTIDGGEPPLTQRVRRMIELRGLEPVAHELGVGRLSLACYLARIPVQAATQAFIEGKLAALPDELAPATPPRCPRCESTSPSVRGLVKPSAAAPLRACAHSWHERGGASALPG